jgi:hypothetical protein
MKENRTFRQEARLAKQRIKSGFWLECKQDMSSRLEKAREQGFNESKVGRFFTAQVSAKIAGEKEDEFYLKVKEMLLKEGEVSNAIGRLTDQEYYQTLSYEEKQRYKEMWFTANESLAKYRKLEQELGYQLEKFLTTNEIYSDLEDGTIKKYKIIGINFCEKKIYFWMSFVPMYVNFTDYKKYYWLREDKSE